MRNTRLLTNFDKSLEENLEKGMALKKSSGNHPRLFFKIDLSMTFFPRAKLLLVGAHIHISPCLDLLEPWSWNNAGFRVINQLLLFTQSPIIMRGKLIRKLFTPKKLLQEKQHHRWWSDHRRTRQRRSCKFRVKNQNLLHTWNRL